MKFKMIAENLHRFLVSYYTRKEHSIFLCGGASREQFAFRKKLGIDIESIKSTYEYRVYFPENIFLELLLGHSGRDLLSLETLLAENVDAVVIPLHSPGTFTELGAFSSHKLLRDKLIILMDGKYRLSNSFINYGPIRYLSKHTKSHILYEPLSIGNAPNIARKVAQVVRIIAARKTAGQNNESFRLDNPLIAPLFYYLLIYIFQPIQKDYIIAESTRFPGLGQKNTEIAEICINGLLSKGDIVASHDKKLYVNQSRSNGYLQASNIAAWRQKRLAKFLTTQRIDAMDYFLRKNREITYKEGLR